MLLESQNLIKCYAIESLCGNNVYVCYFVQSFEKVKKTRTRHCFKKFESFVFAVPKFISPASADIQALKTTCVEQSTSLFIFVNFFPKGHF